MWWTKSTTHNQIRETWILKDDEKILCMQYAKITLEKKAERLLLVFGLNENLSLSASALDLWFANKNQAKKLCAI